MKHIYLLLMALWVSVVSFAQAPQLLSPAPESRTDAASLTRFQVNANHIQAKKLSLKVFINDPRTLLYHTTHAFDSAQQATRPFWMATGNALTLKPNEQYLIELATFHADGSLLAQRYFTIFTKPAAAFTLVSPQSGTTWYVCQDYRYPNLANTGLQILVSHPSTRLLKAKVTNTSGEIVSGYFGPRQEYSMPITASQVGKMVHFRHNLGMGNSLDATLTVTSEDATGGVLGIQTIPFHIEKVPLNRLVGPVLLSPLQGATGISSSPVIELYNTVDSLGMKTLYGCERRISYSSIEILDETGYAVAKELSFTKKYQETPGSITRWKCPAGLTPGKTYTVKVGWTNENDPQFFYNDIPEYITTTFTVDTKDIGKPFTFWPGNEGSIGCKSLYPYLVVSPNAEKVCKMTAIIFINDPRQRVWQYTWNFCASGGYGGLGYMGVYPPTGILAPNTQYLLELTTFDPQGSMMAQTYTAFFTDSCPPGYPSTSGRAQNATLLVETASVASPVPFAETLSVRLQAAFQHAEVRLTTLDGRLIYTRTAKGGTDVSFDTRTLATGMYMVHITDAEGRTEHLRVVKQ